MTKQFAWLAACGLVITGCTATMPTATDTRQAAPAAPTYRVMGGQMQAQEAPVAAPVNTGCGGGLVGADCGDPLYMDKISAGYVFNRTNILDIGEGGVPNPWRYGFPGPVTWMPDCGDNCGTPVAPPVAQPEPEPMPTAAPTEAPHTKGGTPATPPTEAPTDMPTEAPADSGTTTVNY